MIVKPPSDQLPYTRKHEDCDARYLKACKVLRSRGSVLWFGKARYNICADYYLGGLDIPCVQMPDDAKCAVSHLRMA
jgi:hypothetical protein